MIKIIVGNKANNEKLIKNFRILGLTTISSLILLSYIKSNNLQNEGKAIHLESTSPLSNHIVKLDAYETRHGNVVAVIAVYKYKDGKIMTLETGATPMPK